MGRLYNYDISFKILILKQVNILTDSEGKHYEFFTGTVVFNSRNIEQITLVREDNSFAAYKEEVSKS